MKTMTKLAAVILIGCLLFSLCACHEKDETVMTIGEYKIPSGLYIAFVSDAFNAFSAAVNEDLTATGAEKLTDPTAYYDYQHESKTADVWIADEIKKIAKSYVAVQMLAKKNDISLDEEETDYIDQYVNYYWNDQGYDAYYERNGVNKETYKKMITYYLLRNKVFTYYYDQPDEETGKGGIEEVPMSELLTELAKQYVLLETFSISLTSDKTDAEGNAVQYTDAEKAAFKTKLDGYAARINSGKETFAQIAAEYHGKTDETADAASNTSSVAASDSSDTASGSEEKELVSIYPASAAIYSENDVNSQTGEADTANFEKYFPMTQEGEDTYIDGFEYGKAFVTGGDDAGSYTLIIFYDLTKDEYYADKNRTPLIKALREDTYDTMLVSTIDNDKSISIVTDASLEERYDSRNLKFKDEEAE